MPLPDKLKINPWLSIWVRPRDTIRKIVDFNPNYRFPLLAGIYGFPVLLQIAQNLSLGQNFPVFAIVLIALVLAVFLGMLGIVIETGLLLWTGKWIGGQSNFANIKAAVAWSNVPNLVTIITWIFYVAIFRQHTFFYDVPDGVLLGSVYSVVFFLSLVQLTASIWSFVIFLQALGEVQGFSAWKALLNVLIPFVMVVVVLWLFGSLMTTIMTPGDAMAGG